MSFRHQLLEFLCHKETIEEDPREDLWRSFSWFKFDCDREGGVKNEPFSPKWGVPSFLMYHMQDWRSQHFLEIGFYMSIFWLIWLTQRRSSSLQSLLLCVRRSLLSSEHRLLVSGALAHKKRLCPDRQGWYSHFSWAPTSVIGFEKRDWWRTSLSVAWCFSPQGFSACVPRPSVSLASHEPACVSSEPLCTPGEVAAAGDHQSFWSLSWLTSFFLLLLTLLCRCSSRKPVQGCRVGAQGRHLICRLFHLKNGAAVLMHNFTTVKGFALFIESSGLSTWFKLVSHKAST